MQNLPTKLLQSLAAIIALQAPQVAHASKMGSSDGIVFLLFLAGILIVPFLGAQIAIAVSGRRDRGRHCAILAGLAVLYAAIAVGSIMPCDTLPTCAFFGGLGNLAGLLYLPLLVINIALPILHYRKKSRDSQA